MLKKKFILRDHIRYFITNIEQVVTVRDYFFGEIRCLPHFSGREVDGMIFFCWSSFLAFLLFYMGGIFCQLTGVPPHDVSSILGKKLEMRPTDCRPTSKVSLLWE